MVHGEMVKLLHTSLSVVMNKASEAANIDAEISKCQFTVHHLLEDNGIQLIFV